MPSLYSARIQYRNADSSQSPCTRTVHFGRVCTFGSLAFRHPQNTGMTDQPVGQHAAVKRARSNSVESASSSASNKRNSPSVALAAMDLSNDAATSASASAVGGGSGDSSGSGSSDATQPLLSSSTGGEVGQSPTADLVDGKVQLDMVLPTLQQPLSDGDKWFIVDRNWFRRWQAACGGAVDDKGLAEITMQEVGPIDNSRIANPRNGKLTTTVAENENVVFLPGMAWHLLEKWYALRARAGQDSVY